MVVVLLTADLFLANYGYYQSVLVESSLCRSTHLSQHYRMHTKQNDIL